MNDYRLNLAKELGATRTVNVMNEKLEDVMAELGMKEGFDVGLEMSGAPVAFREMVAKMYNGSKIAQLGILPPTTTVDWSEIIFKALTIKGIYGREMWETWYKMQQMLISGLDLSPVITHHFPIADFQKGFDVMESGQCGKVVLEWD
jgi:threonine 3-dehydrogenase